MILEHLDKDNLHHAYLIEGDRELIVPEIVSFLQTINVATVANPDFAHITIDNFKIDDALSLRTMGEQKGYTDNKKIFIVSANSLSLDAQQTLLKMFEEPILNTHFFLVVPDKNALVRTLISRFYFIDASGEKKNLKETQKFFALTPTARIAFLKDFLEEGDEDEGMVATDSSRAKSLRFLNDLEAVLHADIAANSESLEHILQVRKFLRQPGSSTKSLMESVALLAPKMLQ